MTHQSRHPLFPAALLMACVPVLGGAQTEDVHSADDAGTPRSGEEADASPAERCAEVLRRARARDHDPEELSGLLVEVGDRAAGPLLEFLAAERIDLPEGEEPQIVSEAQRDILLDALTYLSKGTVRAKIKELEAREDMGARRAAIHAHGALSGASELQSVLSLALHEDEPGLHRKTEAALTLATQRMVTRDPRTLQVLAVAWSSMQEEILYAVLVGVGEARHAESHALLTTITEHRPELVSLVASQVTKVGPSADRSANQRLARALRQELDPTAPQVHRAVAVALATLKDDDSIGLLINWLDADDPGLVATAHTGLCQLTGLRFAPSAVTWRAWHRRELGWFKREESSLDHRLASSRQVASAILTEIAQRRIRRHELAEKVIPALRHSDEEVRAKACLVLAELGVPVGLTELVDALEDTDRVRESAYAALVRLTGRDADPESPEDWREALALN